MSQAVVHKQKIQTSGGDKALSGFFYVFITLFAIFAIVPFILVLSASFTQEVALNRFGYRLWPMEFSLDAYRLAFKDGGIGNAYIVTIGTTLVGTFCSMAITCAAAYAMSVKSFRSRGGVALFIFLGPLGAAVLCVLLLLVALPVRLLLRKNAEKNLTNL